MTQDDLLGIGFLRIQKMATKLATQIHQSNDIENVEKVKMLLGLGSLSQNVTHVLGAIEMLGQDFHEDVEAWEINDEINDLAQNGKIQASSIDIFSDLVSLKSLIPKNFKMEFEPEETIPSLEYANSFARWTR